MVIEVDPRKVDFVGIIRAPTAREAAEKAKEQFGKNVYLVDEVRKAPRVFNVYDGNLNFLGTVEAVQRREAERLAFDKFGENAKIVDKLEKSMRIYSVFRPKTVVEPPPEEPPPEKPPEEEKVSQGFVVRWDEDYAYDAFGGAWEMGMIRRFEWNGFNFRMEPNVNKATFDIPKGTKVLKVMPEGLPDMIETLTVPFDGEIHIRYLPWAGYVSGVSSMRDPFQHRGMETVTFIAFGKDLPRFNLDKTLEAIGLNMTEEGRREVLELSKQIGKLDIRQVEITAGKWGIGSIELQDPKYHPFYPGRTDLLGTKDLWFPGRRARLVPAEKANFTDEDGFTWLV